MSMLRMMVMVDLPRQSNSPAIKSDSTATLSNSSLLPFRKSRVYFLGYWKKIEIEIEKKKKKKKFPSSTVCLLHLLLYLDLRKLLDCLILLLLLQEQQKIQKVS